MGYTILIDATSRLACVKCSQSANGLGLPDTYLRTRSLVKDEFWTKEKNRPILSEIGIVRKPV